MTEEASSIINECIKCAAKFTSLDRPLKLLPCLHSMCLDCLHGRIPMHTVEKKEQKPLGENGVAEKTEENEKDETKVGNGEIDNDTEKSADGTKPDVETENEPNNSKEDTDNKVSETTDPETNKDTDLEKTTTSDDLKENDEPKTKDGNSEGIQEEKDKPPDDNVEKDEPPNSESADAEEQQDIKPKPAKECPVCKDPIHQNNVSLMDNMFAVLDVSQVLSPGEDASLVCTGCDDGQPATTYCEQCEEWLCDSCVDAHKRVRITKDHTMSPKDQVKKATVKSPWEQQIMCKQHKQEHLKFFCEKCETLTCRDCQLVDHKDHKYQFLDQAAEQYKARLKGSLALMGEKKSKLTLSQEEIKQRLANCKDQKDSLQQEILEQADVLVKGIKQAVWGVLTNLASFTDAATKRLNKEIEDVSDLIGKFDHCIHFMENILSDGSSMSLLYSKGSVEGKCRKVYHTPVDPQSLKGNLLIQYKHDVNWLLGNLSKIGSIYVNGVRYPPEKNGGQNARYALNSNLYQESRANLSGTSPHLQHMANQIPGQQRVSSGEWNTKLIQTVSKPPIPSVAPPNMTISSMSSGGPLPPQLTLPSYRRPQAQPPCQAMSSANFPGHFSSGQGIPQLPPQHMSQSSRPGYTSMRLHHRPAHPSSPFSSQPDRMQNSPHGNMRSPPQYRMGGEASGTSRPSHGTPDPARPASAGMYDGSSRPDSGGGGVAMVDIKKERRDQSPDCVITSSSLRNEKQSHFQTSPMNSRVSETILEMQKNLDDVIRSVPMDLSDNLEQISGLKPSSEVSSSRRSPVLTRNTQNSEERSKSPTDQELRDNWQGGNSMPGFSLPPAVQGDPNDDYCACCHNGGDVLCCDKCPRVFHLQCHIPEMATVPSGSFVCTICEGDKPVTEEDIALTGKPKSALTDSEIKVCERILLDLYCHPSSVPFQEPVNKEQVPNYYKIITQPMNFSQIKCKLSPEHSCHYQTLKAFLFDMRQIFINCAIYNKVSSEVGKAGRMVREELETLISRLTPHYLDFMKENPSPCFSAIQQMSDPDLNESADGPSQAQKRNGEQMGGTNTHEETPPKRLKTGDELAAT